MGQDALAEQLRGLVQHHHVDSALWREIRERDGDIGLEPPPRPLVDRRGKNANVEVAVRPRAVSGSRAEEAQGSQPRKRSNPLEDLTYRRLGLFLATGSFTWLLAAVAVTPLGADSYHTMASPCRVYDSRPLAAPLQGPGGAANRREVQVTGVCGIPAGASAVAINLTAEL